MNTECEDRNDRRRAKRRCSNDCLSELAANNGNGELALRLELADRAAVGIVDVLVRRFGMYNGHSLFGCAGTRMCRQQLVLVLAPQQMVEALPEQHHPRVEDEHAGY